MNDLGYLKEKCDMQEKILNDVNFLLRYYVNNIERKMKQYEQFVKSCEDARKQEQAVNDV